MPLCRQILCTETQWPERNYRIHTPSFIIGGRCHKYHFCRDKRFVATYSRFCRDKNVFVATNNVVVATKMCLSRQKCVCRNKQCSCRDKSCVCRDKPLSRQKCVCRDKTFVATKMCMFLCRQKLDKPLSRQKWYKYLRHKH